VLGVSKVTLHQAWLVLGRATVFGQAGITGWVCNHPPRPTQPPTHGEMGNEYRPKYSDALQLGSKGRYGSFHLWINLCGWQVKLWSLI